MLDRSLLERPDLLGDLAAELAGAHGDEAAALLVQAGNPAVELLASAASDATNYPRRWRAIEALKRLKRDDRVDYAAAYIADLKAEDCAVVKRAAQALADLGDQRAVEPLRVLAQRRSFFLEPCGAPAARAALRKLEKETDAHGGPR